MYNRYIPNGTSYTRVTVDDRPESVEQRIHEERRQEHRQEHAATQRRSGGGQEIFRGLAQPFGFLNTEGKNAGIAGILKGFELGDIDSGDILLMLIVLLLFLEGDNTELVITLGLMLLLGLGGDKKEDHRE